MSLNLTNATEQHRGKSEAWDWRLKLDTSEAGKEKQSRLSLSLSGEQGKWMLGCCL